MEKLDRIIQIIRENMVANAPGQSGGFGADSPAAGPTAGTSPKMSMNKRKGPQIKLPPGSRKRWTPKE
jgi:hypothetical protein